MGLFFILPISLLILFYFVFYCWQCSFWIPYDWKLGAGSFANCILLKIQLKKSSFRWKRKQSKKKSKLHLILVFGRLNIFLWIVDVNRILRWEQKISTDEKKTLMVCSMQKMLFFIKKRGSKILHCFLNMYGSAMVSFFWWKMCKTSQLAVCHWNRLHPIRNAYCHAIRHSMCVHALYICLDRWFGVSER